MRVLSISIDRHVFDPKSAVSQRLALYGEQLDVFHLVVPSFQKGPVVSLSKTTTVYPAIGKGKLLQFFSVFFKIRTLCRAHAYDVITVQDPFFIGFLGVICSRLFHIPLEVQVHGWESSTFVRNMFARFVLQRADNIRVVSTRLRNKVVHQFSLSEEGVSVIPVPSTVAIPTGIQPKVYHKPSEKQPWVFLTVGRFVPVKQLDMQVRAMATLVAQGIMYMRLIIIGEGPSQLFLEQLIKEHNLASYVSMHPWQSQSNLHEFYEQADVYLLTSKNEGWPRVIMEAAAYGLPVIMTNVGSAREFVRHEQEGLILEEHSPATLAMAMQRMMTDEALYVHCSTSLLASIRSYPTMETLISQYMASWRKIAKKH